MYVGSELIQDVRTVTATSSKKILIVDDASFMRTVLRDIIKGNGLGLPSCKVIVEKHHGMISFVSTVGRGTTFTIMLPKLQPKTAL
jgi:signal transduction histidine kinase